MRQAPKLPADSVAKIKGMLARGDRQADIALWFSVSASTVSSIKFNRIPAYRGIARCPDNDLPPQGPYAIVSQRVHDVALSARAARDMLVAELQTLIGKYASDDTQEGQP